MSTVKPRGLWRKNRPAEIETAVWIAERQIGTGQQLEEIVRRISLTSTREIDRLIGDLTDLRNELERRSSRIQNDIVEYAGLSQSVVELTKIVSDSVAKVEKRSGTPSRDVAELAVPRTPEGAHGEMPALPGA